MVFVHYLENWLSQCFHNHMLIGLREKMTLLILRSLGRRVRSQRWLLQKNVDMVFAHYLENCLSQSFYISHDDWSWWEHNTWCFRLSRSKINVTWVTFVITYILLNSFYWTSSKLLIIKPKVTYPIPIYNVTSCQSHFFSMNLFIIGSLYLLITLQSNPLFDRSSQGSMCRPTFLVIFYTLNFVHVTSTSCRTW